MSVNPTLGNTKILESYPLAQPLLTAEIVQTTMNTLHAEVCSIFLEDTDPNYFICVAGSGFASKIVGAARYRIGEGFTGSVAKHGGEYNIKSLEELKKVEIEGQRVWKGNFDQPQWGSGHNEFRNLLALRLQVGDHVFGVIKAENKIDGDYFTEHDMLVFKTIANAISFALENERLHRETEEQSRQISVALAEIVNAVAGHYNEETLLGQIVRTTESILEAEVCSIFLRDEREPKILKCVAGSGFANRIVGEAKYELGEGFTGSVALYGEEYQIYNIKSRKELEEFEINGKRVWQGKCDSIQWPSGESEFNNLLAFPLRIGEETMGVLKVENKIGGGDFTSRDETVFGIIGSVIVLAIEKTLMQLRIAEQLNRISAMASHRINNLLVRYSGLVWIMRDYADQGIISSEKLSEIADELDEATKDIFELVGEFRNYGKPVQVQLESSNINVVLGKAIKEHSRMLEANAANIEIQTELADHLPEVKIDTARFPESILELLHNAIRILETQEKKGVITIGTHAKCDKEGRVEAVVVTIKDNGPGFPKEFPFFEPFNSTDPNRTGLGLATVKQNIEAHGGTIELVTDETGVCFELAIPVAEQVQ